MVPVNGMMLNKCKSFVTLGKGQFKLKVKIEGEKHIYSIPAKHSHHLFTIGAFETMYVPCTTIDIIECLFIYYDIINYSVTITLSSLLCHHYSVTITLSPLLCHHYSVIITLSSLLCHHYSVIITLSPLLCHHYSVIITLSSLLCHHYSVTITLSPLLCHHYSVIITLSSLLCHHYFVIQNS